MPNRVGSGTGPTPQQLRDSQQLGDMIRQFTAPGRTVSMNEVTNLTAWVSRDGQIRPEEAALLTLMLNSKADAFTPEAANALRQFVARAQGSETPVDVAPRGWTPASSSASTSKPQAYRPINGPTAPNDQQTRDARQLGDMIRQRMTTAAPITSSDVQRFLALVTRDRQLRPDEAALLTLLLQSRPDSFSPEAADELRQFLAPLQGQTVPVEVEPRGWGQEGVPANLRALRSDLQQMLSSGRKISGSQAQDLIRHVLGDDDTRSQAFSYLFSQYQQNQASFSPDGKRVIEAFIVQRGTEMLDGADAVDDAADVEELGAAVADVGRADLDEPPARIDRNRRPDLSGGLSNRVVNGARQAGIQGLFDQALSGNGPVKLGDVERIVRMADRSGWVEGAEIQPLAQGFRDNRSRFSPEAAAAMEQFLARYGY